MNNIGVGYAQVFNHSEYGLPLKAEITWGLGGSLIFATKNPQYFQEVLFNKDDYQYSGSAHWFSTVYYRNGQTSGTNSYIYVTEEEGGGGGVACFKEGTTILTSNGIAPIESIKQGDYVLSKNEQGQIEEQKVYHTYNHKPRSSI